ncbi:MAG: hypothetical protein WBA51_05750 [Erythrobacter sp.]
MQKPVGLACIFALGLGGCASVNADPLALQQGKVDENNPFIHILADSSQRNTNGSLKNPLPDPATGAFFVEIGPRGGAHYGPATPPD